MHFREIVNAIHAGGKLTCEGKEVNFKDYPSTQIGNLVADGTLKLEEAGGADTPPAEPEPEPKPAAKKAAAKKAEEAE